MKCPFCGHSETAVAETRVSEDGDFVRRRRQCSACDKRFTTYERLEEAPLWVVKRGGQREPFDRVKVVAGVRAATKNRPVSEERLEEIAQEVEDALRGEGAEVESQQIGVAVLERLREVDDVAYLRFASVYRSFDSLADF